MSDEWTELTDIQSVAMAQANGWEIEALACDCEWYPWTEISWTMGASYRGRPKKPKKITVTSECWRHPEGELRWGMPNDSFGYPWKRFPAGDTTGEVGE